MAYAAITDIATDALFARRLYGGAASEGIPNPESWVYLHRYALAAQPGWAGAVESALAADPDAQWQTNEAVITDGMILAAIRGLLKPPVSEVAK